MPEGPSSTDSSFKSRQKHNQDILLARSQSSRLSQLPLSCRFLHVLRKGKRSKDELILHERETLKQLLLCKGMDDLLFFTEGGKVFKKKAYELELKSVLEQKGDPIRTYIPNLDEKDNVVQIMRLSEEDYANPNMFLIFVSSLGYAKRIHISKFRRVIAPGKIACRFPQSRQLKGDKINFVLKNSKPKQELMMASTERPSSKGTHRINNIIKVSLDSFFMPFRGREENTKPPMVSTWRRTLKLEEGQQVLSASTTHEGETLLRMDSEGRITVFDWNKFIRQIKFAARGMLGFKTEKGSNNRCIGFALVKPEDLVLFTTSQKGIYKTSMEKWPINRVSVARGGFALHPDLADQKVSVTGFNTLPKDDFMDALANLIIAPEA